MALFRRGGIQEIEYIKVYEGKYFVKMRFYGEGYFTLEGNHVDIVSVGHVINMKMDNCYAHHKMMIRNIFQ